MYFKTSLKTELEHFSPKNYNKKIAFTPIASQCSTFKMEQVGHQHFVIVAKFIPNHEIVNSLLIAM